MFLAGASQDAIYPVFVAIMLKFLVVRVVH